MRKPPREQLPELYGALVAKIAREVLETLEFSVDLEELYQWGMIGLLRAWDRYDPNTGVALSTYAYARIRGEMLDKVGKTTGLKRAQIRDLVRLRRTIRVVDLEADDATVVGSDDRAYVQRVWDTFTGAWEFSHYYAEGEEIYGPDSVASGLPSPEDMVVDNDRRLIVRQCISALSEEEAWYIQAYYYEGKSIPEAAKERGVSRSWGNRVLGRATQKLGRLVAAKIGLEEQEPENSTQHL